ncbi:MAG: ABC transporter ATP-binding protein [Candidatus Aerophobetes bacterium]|nr:ABC transporter ATP-binding protein [Candidatus Aerophobetes bacterium]
MNTQYRLMRYLRSYIKILILTVVCAVFVTLCTLAIPWFLGKGLIDKVIIEKNLFLLNLVALGIVAAIAIKGVFYYLQTYLSSFIGYKVVTDMRNQIFQHLQKLSLSFYKKRRTGEIMSRVVDDVNVLQEVIANRMIRLFLNFLIMVGVLAFLFYIDWKLSLCVLAVFPFLLFTINRIGSRVKKFSTSVQAKMADVSSILQETIGGIEVIKSFATEDQEIKKFEEQNIINLRLGMKRAQQVAMLPPIVEILTTLGLVVILWYGAREVIGGVLSIGELVAFLGYVGLAVNPLNQISRNYSHYERGLASAARIFEILDIEPEIKELPSAVEMLPVKGYIKFEDVSFSYNDKELVLENINLDLRPGERIALVGPSGVGKTTLVSLIPRFYDPTSGKVAVDGQEIRKVKLTSLREQIGIVPQETILFGGSIRDNIAYSKMEATNEEIVEAAKKANAHDFISSLPDGYETQVGERGVKLSGGERQRIAIARAILRDPRILILDEATSAVDAEAEVLIQEALEKLMRNKTTIIIAHRLSTILGADKIVVLKGGKVEEVGSHEGLMAKNGLYARLYENQFKT